MSTLRRPLFPAHAAALVVAAFLTVISMSGCGARKDRAATQTAARVNKDEVTVHQINYVLQQQRGLRPEQAEAAGRQALERLIDQQLAVQKADDLKLDRDPRVVQQLEAARREVLTRAYAEKIGGAASKPTPDEIRKYYQDKPGLFSQRRIYNFQEIAIEARPEQVVELRARLAAAKNLEEFVAFLKANDYRFGGSQTRRAAEQLPLSHLELFAGMKDGQTVLSPGVNGVQVLFLQSSVAQPVSEEQARAAIEQFILNERKRKLIDDDLKSLRAAARIEYMGKFAAAAASAASAAPAGALAPSPADSGASAALTQGEITRGMGLKP